MFYIDPTIGASINASLGGQKPPRPLTHDLYMHTLEAFGAKVSRAVIMSKTKDVFYARLILEAENEVMERKIVELDSRPSDSIAVAVRSGAPIYMVKELWDSQEDMTGILSEMNDDQDPDLGEFL